MSTLKLNTLGEVTADEVKAAIAPTASVILGGYALYWLGFKPSTLGLLASGLALAAYLKNRNTKPPEL